MRYAIFAGKTQTGRQHCCQLHRFRILQDTIRIQSLMGIEIKREALLSAMSAVKSIISRTHMKHIRELRRRIWNMRKRLIHTRIPI